MFFDKECIYLDASATSRYKPACVVKRVEKELKHSANAGRGGHKAALKALESIEECRESVTELTFECDVILTKSCTEALNIAILGGDYRGEILTTVYEHNSVLRPLERLKKRGARIRYLSSPDGIVTPDLLRSNIRSDTSLVCIQEMSNVTGKIQPIDELGNLLESYRIPFLVDGAQSLGHTECGYNGVTMLAGAGHKGLHGPQGTGFLCVRKGVKLTPIICGGTGTSSSMTEQPSEIPEGFEAGTQNAPGFAGLSEGILWTLKNKRKINRRIRALSEKALEGLGRIDGVVLYYDEPNGVIYFNVGSYSSSDVADMLDIEYSIAVRSGIHCAPLIHRWMGTLSRGAVRASFGYGNRISDVDALIYAVKEISEKKKTI